MNNRELIKLCLKFSKLNVLQSKCNISRQEACEYVRKYNELERNIKNELRNHRTITSEYRSEQMKLVKELRNKLK